MAKRRVHQQSMVVTQKLPEMLRRFQSGDQQSAATGLLELASLAPDDGRVFDLLSTVQAMLAHREQAVLNARKALELIGDQPGVVARCASVLQRAGEYDEALANIERALYQEPGNAFLTKLKVTLLTDLGKDRQAHKALKALKKSAGTPGDINGRMGIALLEARLAPATVDAAESVGELEQLVYDPVCAQGFQTAGAFQLGRLQEHFGDYDKAFKAFAFGKSVNKPEWDPEAHSARIDQLIDCWTNAGEIGHSTADGSGLVFIVGMMRSGTSLTEQMVAQCKGVVPGDELNIVDHVVNQIEGAEERPLALSLGLYTASAIDDAADRAVKAYKERFGNQVGTDKQPENFYHLPLIARLFPGCKIIHCMRDPMDCCVSNFVQSFAHGFPHTHDLEWMGRYHRDYQRVMDAWRALPEINMLELSYEDLVSDPESQTKRIAEYLEVEWTQDMLRFHESKRVVKTASREQVRSAINTRSIGRHERFADHLAELSRALEIPDA